MLKYQNKYYTLDDFEELTLPLGYKINFVSLSNNTLPEEKILQFNPELLNWIDYVQKECDTDLQWVQGLKDFLTSVKVFSLETLVQIPECYWTSMGFKAIGLKKELTQKIQELKTRTNRSKECDPSVESIMQCSMEIESTPIISITATPLVPLPIKQHKYTKTDINFEELFSQNEADRQVFDYFTNGYEAGETPNRVIDMLKQELIQKVFDDIRSEIRKTSNNQRDEWYPPTFVLANVAKAMSKAFPGLVDLLVPPHCKGEHVSLEQKQHICSEVLFNKRTGRPDGSLYNKFSNSRNSMTVRTLIGNPPKQKKQKIDEQPNKTDASQSSQNSEASQSTQNSKKVHRTKKRNDGIPFNPPAEVSYILFVFI